MNVLRLIGGVLLVGLLSAIGILWFQTFIVGGLYRTSGVLWTMVLGLVPVAILAALYYGFKGLGKLRNLSLLVLAAVFAGGCSYAHSNVQTLVTHDCGVSWELIKPGQVVPRGTGNYCFRSVTIPDYPMDGNSEFKSNFKNNVKATIDLDYSYRITDAIAFIGEAKYIGAQSKGEDEKANDSGFERAENVVIDKRIRDVSRDMLLQHDIVDFSPADFEDALLPKVNEALAPLGIQIDFLSFVPVPDEQTAQAIDSATAMRIYQANGLGQVGSDIIKAKAGASRINITQPTTPATK